MEGHRELNAHQRDMACGSERMAKDDSTQINADKYFKNCKGKASKFKKSSEMIDHIARGCL